MFKVCAAQVASTKYDKAENLKKAESVMKKAADSEADVIIFPEMYLTGYTVGDRLEELSEDLGGESIKKMASYAKDNHLLTVFGFPECSSSRKPYNSACIIEPDGTVLGSYRKTHLVGDEDQIFRPGESINTFETSIGTVGIMICYDIEFPEVARILAINGAQAIFMIAANMVPYEDYHIKYVPVRAMENSVFIASSNQVFEDDVFKYCGLSAIVNPKGDFLAKGGLDKEELLVAEINFEETYSNDKILNYLSHRRPDLYRAIIKK